jgi:D-tagatose-1,6-bisphosphate aldolase subunit GatZ/KbaZ
VQEEIGQLLKNLSDKKLQPTVMSQFLPLEYEAIRSGILQASAKEIIRFHIQTVLRIYASACK